MLIDLGTEATFPEREGGLPVQHPGRWYASEPGTAAAGEGYAVASSCSLIRP